MKSFLTFVCLLLALLCFGLFSYFADTEYQVMKWQVCVSEAEQFERDIQYAAEQFEAMQTYVEVLTDIISDMAAENSLLCARDAKMVETVAMYEEENRRLKESVKEAVKNLQDQEKEINKLIDENSRLSYKVRALEDALEAIKEAKDKMQADQSMSEMSYRSTYLGIAINLIPILF